MYFKSFNGFSHNGHTSCHSSSGTHRVHTALHTFCLVLGPLLFLLFLSDISPTLANPYRLSVCKCHFLWEVLTDSPIWIMSLVTVTITLLFLSFVTATVNYHFSLVFIFGVFKRNISNIHRPFLENNITHILHLTLSYLNIFVLFVTDLF